MDLKLISNDTDLHKLCREILRDLPAAQWTVSMDTTAAGADADLYIWDYQRGAELPPAAERVSSRHLYLVNRKDIPALQEEVGATEGNILLKPVTRATLGAFLGLAILAQEERVSAAASLKADRDEILQCLIQANLKLQEYDQDRTNFLARAVHDFRAPLTAISGYCGLLLSEPLGPLNDEQKEVLRRMMHSSKRLSRMAAAMFQLSVGRHVKRRPDFRPGDLRETVEQALHEIAQFADSKHISISVNLSPEPTPVHYEAGPIEQVLINLLDNAVKFAPRSGEIELRGYPFFWERRSKSEAQHTPNRRVRTSREPNCYRIDIIDSGTPIPAEHLDRIFEEYTSYAGGNDRSGGGLGLAICRMIVSQHEGQVWAENTATGPMFSFVLPFHTADNSAFSSGNDALPYLEVL